MNISQNAVADYLFKSKVAGYVTAVFCLASLGGLAGIGYVHQHIQYDPANAEHQKIFIEATPGCAKTATTPETSLGLFSSYGQAPRKGTITAILDSKRFENCVDQAVQDRLPSWENYVKKTLQAVFMLSMIGLGIQSRRLGELYDREHASGKDNNAGSPQRTL